MDAYKLVIKEQNKYSPLIKYYPQHLKAIMGVVQKRSFTHYRIGQTYSLKDYDTCPVIVCSKGYHLFKEPVKLHEHFSKEVFDALLNQNKLGYLKLLRCHVQHQDILAHNKFKIRVKKFKVLEEI